jgi:hypothetical protein
MLKKQQVIYSYIQVILSSVAKRVTRVTICGTFSPLDSGPLLALTIQIERRGLSIELLR